MENTDKLFFAYNQTPLWKKILLCCILNRSKWKLAVAYNKVAADMFLTERHELGRFVQIEGDKIWAEIYKKERGDN